MNLAPLLALVLFAAASPSHDGSHTIPAPTAHDGAVMDVAASDAGNLPVAALHPGESAPDFDYLSSDYFRRRLHDVLEEGDVLFVLGGSDDQLRALESSRDGLLAAGVVPVALTLQREKDALDTVRRCHLGYSLLSDPKGAVAEQYGLVDSTSRALAPGWFVIDRSGHVRAAGSCAAGRVDWVALATNAMHAPDGRMASAR